MTQYFLLPCKQHGSTEEMEAIASEWCYKKLACEPPSLFFSVWNFANWSKHMCMVTCARSVLIILDLLKLNRFCILENEEYDTIYGFRIFKLRTIITFWLFPYWLWKFSNFPSWSLTLRQPIRPLSFLIILKLTLSTYLQRLILCE